LLLGRCVGGGGLGSRGLGLGGSIPVGFLGYRYGCVLEMGVGAYFGDFDGRLVHA
jgi:hypothetical protein